MKPDEPLPELEPAARPVYERALVLLSAHARSARQLERRLIEKGEAPALVAQVIARLVANGLCDDAAFAASRARSAIQGKARSRQRVAQTLAKDGVARDVAERAIAEAMAEEGGDELSSATRAAEKKLRSLGRLEPAARRDKLRAFLARQGFGAEVVRTTLRRVLADEGVADADDGGDD